MARRVLVLEGSHIIFKNFTGAKGKFNKEGERSFAVQLRDPAFAEELANEGWNVRYPKPLDEPDEEDNRFPYLPVKCNFSGSTFDPQVVLVQPYTDVNGNPGTKEERLTADTVHILDGMNIVFCDIIINPYNYDVLGKQGVSAYLKKIYVNIEPDVFNGRYRI